MLSIQPLQSAEGSAAYYLNAVNYYENNAKSVRWLGDGAKILGIHGQPIEKESMLPLLKGMLPDGTQLGRIDKDGVHHRPGFDMTLSAPKSFSILLESGADPRLGEALDEAIEWFVDEMQKEFAQTRQVVNGKVEYIDTKNFVIASFRHPNSRANDPQSHGHLVVLNMTHCVDEKWRSLASDMTGQKGVVEQIMKHHIYGGLKFRNKLASLTKALGHELETDGEGMWEIKGVPGELITHYSKRRESIETKMSEEGWSGAKAASIATQRTKLDKEIVDFDQWKKDILSECQEHGFDPIQLVKQTYKQDVKNTLQTIKEKIVERFYGKEHLELNHAKEAVYVAIESVSQQEAVFDRRTLKKEALKYSIASNTLIDERLLDRMIDEKITSQELYQATHPYTKKTLLTTPWQLTMESETIQRIEQGKGAIAAICSKQTVTDFIKAKEQEMGFSLSVSQKKAMVGFLTTTDRYMAIQGYAGTGKTTMLRLTRELASLHGYTIRGVTAGSAAAHELRTKGGLNASTFARELGQLQNQKQNLSKTIFVVDEASMLSNPQGHKIIKLAQLYHTQLVVIGDRAQLPSPSSGKLFAVTQDYGIDTVAMTDNLRQTDPELKESALHASLGEIYDAVEKLTHVEARESYEERIQYTANKWLSLTPIEREKTLCFAPTHKNRHDITIILREALHKEGALTGIEHEQITLKEKNLTSMQLRKTPYYTKDDVIRFNTNIPKYHIKAGDYLTVQAITQKQKDKNTLALQRENGQSFVFKLSALPKFQAENKDLERPIEVYWKQILPIMAGDKIQWKRNFEKMEIRNAELATIKQITEEGIELVSEANHLIYLDKQDKALQHLDHGYALTTYAAQGKDKKRGLSLLDSKDRFATTIQNYYVGTTRGIEEMTVVTDDKENLVKAITTNDSDKYSSLEMVNSETLKAHNARFKDSKNSLVLQNVIERKLLKEEAWNNLEHVVETYVQNKQCGEIRKATINAFTIVNDPILYRLAKERLGFSEYTYRQEALRYETAKLFHTLPQVERARFSVVRQYVLLNKQVVNKSNQIKTNAIDNNVSIDNKRALQEMASRRNALAGIISRELEQFKPYLKHYSIGELNRIGLSQYHYGQETKKALNRLELLAKHATRDAIKAQVSDYVNATGEQKEAIASRIKRESSLSHPFILTHAKTINEKPESLWKSIQNDAKSHSDRLFRNGLNTEGKMAFDAIKAYKQVQADLRANWSRNLKEAEQKGIKTGIDSQSMELLTMRNALAHQVMNNKATPEIASHFNLDLTSLSLQNQKHLYRENINQFKSSKGNFSARLGAISAIKNDMKSHYPFIKEANLDIKLISKYLRVTDRMERFNTLPAAEVKAYKQFLLYKSVSMKAYAQWQQVHHLKAEPFLNKNHLINQAMNRSAERDALAYTLKDSPYLDSILIYEKGNKEKIAAHASNHQLKLRELNEVNKAVECLSTQYNSIVSNQSAKAVAAWKSHWFTLSNHVKQIEKKLGYHVALKENPMPVASIKTINQELEQHYKLKPESNKNLRKTLNNPILIRIKKTAQHLDARTINECLMANPEQTYTEILGEPKSQNTRELRFSGGLIISLKGKDRGLWYDFSDGVGGAPIQAIMKRDNLTFKEALTQAAQMAGMGEIQESMPSKKATFKPDQSLSISKEMEAKNKIISAKSIWYGSVEVKGTLAEKYLRLHRGLDNVSQLDIRFWQKGTPWKNCTDVGLLENKINPIPALIFAARNEKNEITGVQRIYLDSMTGKKNAFMDKPKLSKGVIEGSCGLIQKGMRGSRLYIAEGPETAASIAMADSKATVLVSFGVSNMKNLNEIIKKHKSNEVIIAADNDGTSAKSTLAIYKTIDALKQHGINATAVFPKPLEGHIKTDWNDILINKGVFEIKNQLANYGRGNLITDHLKSMEIPEKIRYIGINNSIKLNDKQLESIKIISATMDKNQNINQLVSAYNKTNQSVEKVRSVAFSQTNPLKKSREIEMEL